MLDLRIWASDLEELFDALDGYEEEVKPPKRRPRGAWGDQLLHVPEFAGVDLPVPATVELGPC